MFRAMSRFVCAALRLQTPSHSPPKQGGLSAGLKLNREKVIDSDQHDQQSDAETEVQPINFFSIGNSGSTAAALISFLRSDCDMAFPIVSLQSCERFRFSAGVS
jgi:hypothetical protein